MFPPEKIPQAQRARCVAGKNAAHLCILYTIFLILYFVFSGQFLVHNHKDSEKTNEKRHQTIEDHITIFIFIFSQFVDPTVLLVRSLTLIPEYSLHVLFKLFWN